jgi:hypothetical protein
VVADGKYWGKMTVADVDKMLDSLRGKSPAGD